MLWKYLNYGFWVRTQEMAEECLMEGPHRVPIFEDSEIDIDAYPPANYSWVVPKKLAAMALPRNQEHLRFIVNEGINHLITLSAEKKPPISECEFNLKWTEIPVEEFQTPSLDEISRFIEICKNAEKQNEVIGVHCRLGRSRCSVLLAAYFIHFYHLSADQAITVLKKMRPGSCDSPELEDMVQQYYQHVSSKSVGKYEASEAKIEELLSVVIINGNKNKF